MLIGRLGMTIIQRHMKLNAKMEESRLSKLHSMWIRYFVFSIIGILVYSCQSNYDLKSKLSNYLGDTKEIAPSNVCIEKANGYVFAKQCNLKNYEIVIPIESLDEQYLDVIRLYNMNNIDYFFECTQVVETYKVDAIFFDKFPDTLNLNIYEKGILKKKILFKYESIWTETK